MVIGFAVVTKDKNKYIVCPVCYTKYRHKANLDKTCTRCGCVLKMVRENIRLGIRYMPFSKGVQRYYFDAKRDKRDIYHT